MPLPRPQEYFLVLGGDYADAAEPPLIPRRRICRVAEKTRALFDDPRLPPSARWFFDPAVLVDRFGCTLVLTRPGHWYEPGNGQIVADEVIGSRRWTSLNVLEAFAAHLRRTRGWEHRRSDVVLLTGELGVPSHFASEANLPLLKLMQRFLPVEIVEACCRAATRQAGLLGGTVLQLPIPPLKRGN